MSAIVLLAFLTLQRFTELIIASKNTKELLRRGAYERGSSHYPVMVLLHGTWLATLWIFGWSHAVVLPFLAAFVLLQIARIWILSALGGRWTTRIIILPGAAPVRSGPYRFLRHPNYVVVALEIPCVSLAVGIVWHAILFGGLNLAMLWWRIRAEDRAFRENWSRRADSNC